MGVRSTIRLGPTDLRQIAWKFTLPRTRAALKQPGRRRLLVWWPVAVIALLICAGLRGFADDIGFAVHGSEIERDLFGSPTLWLQHHVYSLWPGFFGWGSVIVHASWFPVPWITALLVSWRRPERIGSFFRWWIALHAGVLVPFVLFPLEPPWMAEAGVTRIVAQTLNERMDDANALAAMPSLHVALPLTIAAWFYRERWTAPASVMMAYSGIVASEVVFSGEHYVVDVVGAAGAAGLIYLVASVDARRLFSRRLFSGIRRLASAPASGQSESFKPVGSSQPAFSSSQASRAIADAAVSQAAGRES